MAYVSPFEDAPQPDEGQLQEASGANDNVLTRSLRGGVYGAGSQLLSAGAGVADAAGADGVGESLHQTSRGLRDRAALPGNAPRVSSFKQLKEAPTLDNAGEYLGGLVGGSLPATALGIAGGVIGGRGGMLRGMAGAGAATMPLNTGEIIQRQQDDPQAMQQGAGQRLREAALGGAAASAAESIVPGLVGRQILGKGMANLGKESIGQIVGRNALDIPLEGLSEGAGTAVKQFATNQDAPLDWDEIGEGAIGGAAAGSVFSGVGTAADLARMPGNRAGEALSSARTSIKERLASAKDKLAGKAGDAAASTAGKRVASLGEDLSSLFESGRGAMDRVVESVRKGEVLGDLKDLAGATPERIKEAMDLSDNQAAQRAAEWGQQMMNDAGLTPERRAQVAEAVAAAGTSAGQAAMAGLKKSWDTTQRAREKLARLRKSIKNRPVDVHATEVTTARIGDGDIIDVEAKKLSADYSGVNTAIAQKLRPLLTLRRQELLEDPQDLLDVADASRETVETMTKGKLTSDTIFRLIDALGDDTASTLDATFRAIGDPSKAEAFYQQLNELADTQGRAKQLKDVVAASMTEEAKQLYSSDQLGEVVQALVTHARGERQNPNIGPAQRAAADREFREQFTMMFGDKADAVSLAIEKEAGLNGARADKNDAAPSTMDEDGNMKESEDDSFDNDTGERLSAEKLDIIYVGAGKDERHAKKEQAELLMHPDLFKSSRQPGMNRAQQAVNNAKERHGENTSDPRTIRFEYAEGSRTHGYVVAERSADPDSLTDAEVDSMRLDTKSRSNSPDRVVIPASKKTGGKPIIIDSWRVAHTMHGRLNRGALDDNSSRERMARMFIEGVARLIEKFGTDGAPIEIGDGVRIAKLNGKDLTWGEAKQLGQSRKTERDRGGDSNTAQVQEAQKELLTLGEGDDDRRFELESLIQEIEADREGAKAYEWGLRKIRGGRVVDTTNKNRGEDELTGDPMNPDKAGNIHDATRRIKGDDRPLFADAEGEFGRGGRTGAELMTDKRDTRPNENLINKSNMDGSGHFVSDKSDFVNTMKNVATEMAQMSIPAGKKTAAKLLRLVRPHIMMSKMDKMRMASLAVSEVKFTRKAELINELAEKYADAMRKRGPQKAGKPGDKAPVFDDFEMEMESDDYSASEPVFDAPMPDEPVRRAELRAPVTMFEKAVAQRMKALTPQSAAAHEKWARAALDEGRARNEFEVAALDALLDAAQGGEGGSPSPKAVAAKKAAFLERAASGDKALIDELRSSDDAKGLQRAAGALATRAGGYSRARFGEYVSGPRTSAAVEADAYADRVIARIHQLANEGDLNWQGDKDNAMRGFTKMLAAAMTGAPRGRENLDRLRAAVEMNSSLVSPELNAAVRDKLTKSAKAPLGWYMDAIISDKGTPALMKTLAKAVGAMGRDVTITGLPTDMMQGAYGLYHPDTGKVNIVNDTKLNMASTVLHEGVHAVTANGLTSDPALHAALNALLEHVVRQDSVVAVSYGVTNTLEFLAEGLSNEGFQARLRRIPANAAVRKYLGENVANAWEGFVGMVRKALGLRPQDTNALMQLLDLSGRAMKAGNGHIADTTILVTNQVVPFREIRRLVGRILSRPHEDGVIDLLNEMAGGSQEGGDRLTQVALEVLGMWAESMDGRTLLAADARKIAETVASNMGFSALVASRPHAALDAVNERLAELVKDPDVAYGLQTKKYSAQSTSSGTSQTANARANVEAHIAKVLGPAVKVEWANLTHAGEFERMPLHDVIRLSVHALDPMSTAFHESLHGFFAKLRDAGGADVISVLQKAAGSEHVMEQLKARFAGEPGVLAQLNDPEERAAYMYQVWATDPTFKVSIQARSTLQKVAAFVRKVLGIWSNDERALHIMDFFHSGEFVKQGTQAGRASMMKVGTNGALETAKELTAPMANFADAVVSTGSGRLRATENSALIKLADLIKRESTDRKGGDAGFIPAARIARTERLNALGGVLEGYTQEQLDEALQALQADTAAPSAEGRLAVRAIKKVLQEIRQYMVSAGVDVGDLGPDYFPRVWDTHYISKNQAAFRDMLEPYKRNGQFKGDIDSFMSQLTSRDGAEVGIETRTPGMQFAKERVLSFIEPSDAAPFLNKSLLGTLSTYVNQATRRAEWNRRLGGGKLEELFKAAGAQGATPDQLKLANTYLSSVDGTLGDGLNPDLRRLMGNMIVYQNVRLLPMAVFSSIVDPVGVMVRGGTMGDAWKTFKRGIAEIPQSYGRKPSADEATELAELVGVIDSAVLSSVMGDLYTQGMVGGTAQKINTAFFKYNMMEGLNRSFRVGASEAAMAFIARHADGTHSVHSKRWMDELGLKSSDVVLTPSGRMALTTADGLTVAQAGRVRSAINQWVDGAVLRPDAADKPIWMSDPHWALVSHLKQFVYTFQKVILNRVFHEVKQGNYVPLMALAAYVPVMMASDFTKGLIQGGGDQPEWKKGWEMSDYVGHGIQRSGLLGVGQFGYDVVEDMNRGGTGVGALSGPTVEQLIRALEVMGGNREFGPMLLKSMPANALYGGLADSEAPAVAQSR